MATNVLENLSPSDILTAYKGQQSCERGKPRRWQERWNGKKWVKGLKGIKREDIPVYRHAEIQKAIARDLNNFYSGRRSLC